MATTTASLWSCTKLRFLCSLSGTVIRNIWMRIILAVLYTIVIKLFYDYVPGFRFGSGKSSTINITAFGTVVALLLAFRTNTAYDRYWEGRKLWSTVTHNIRSLTRYVWVVVEENNVEDTAEKVSIINLLVAFPFAVKNYLREDYSYESPELRELLSRVPQFVSTHGGAGGGYGNGAFTKGIPCFARNTKQCGVTITDEPPVLLDGAKESSKPAKESRSHRRDTFRAHAEPKVTNIPLEILFHFTSYVNKLATMDKPVPTTFLNAMNAIMTSMSDAYSGLDRILQTPIPFAYAVHLEHVVWIYLLALPSQLVGALGWWTVSVMASGSFCMLGILDIASEIENPFGDDYNDLPLDEICERIKVEAFKTVGISIYTSGKDEKCFLVNRPPIMIPFEKTLNEADLPQKTGPDELT